MASVRAKFRVTETKQNEGSPSPYHTITLAPVYGNGDPNHENTKFWKATPSGQITLGVINHAAAQAFEVGKEYYVDFTPAE